MRKPSLIAVMFLLLVCLGSLCGFTQEPARPPREQVNPPQELANVPQASEPELEVPLGTVIPIVLTSYLNSRNSQVGDTFYADTAYPIYIQQRLAIPKGSTVKGTVTHVERPGRIKGKGRLAVRIDSVLLPNGVSRDLMAAFRGIHGPGDEKIDRKSETVTGGGNKGEDAGQVIGTSSQGAIIGAISGGGKGAGIGAGAGAAVGLATVLLTRGRDLVLEPGTQFDLELRQPLRFAYGELDFTTAELNSAQRLANPRSRNDRNRQSRPSSGRRGIGLPLPWPYSIW